MTRSRRYAIGALLCLLIAVLDQASKTWLIAYMAGQPPSGVTVTSFFDLVMVWNYGVSFGLFNNGSDGQTWVLIGVAAGVVLLLVAWLGRVERAWLAAAIGAVIGGCGRQCRRPATLRRGCGLFLVPRFRLLLAGF